MFKARLFENRQGSAVSSVFLQVESPCVLSSKKEKLHCSAVKSGGLLGVVGFRCHFAMFFFMQLIVIVVSRMTVFCFCFCNPGQVYGLLLCLCLSQAVSDRAPALRDASSSSSTLLSLMGLLEVHGVMKRKEQLTKSDFRSVDLRFGRVISEGNLGLELLVGKLHT